LTPPSLRQNYLEAAGQQQDHQDDDDDAADAESARGTEGVIATTTAEEQY